MVWNKDKWEKKFQAFAMFLREQEELGKTTEQFCTICGRSGIFLFYNDGIPVCAGCRDSRVSSLQDAAGILYLVYGNFSRMFEVRFRYPNLFFLETEAGSIEQLDGRRGNYNGLVTGTGQPGYDFTLGIAQNIPSAFLEEIFVFSFSKMYLREKIAEWGNKDNVSERKVSFSWNDIYQRPNELMKAVRELLVNRGKLIMDGPNKNKKEQYTEANVEIEKCERAIMICYFYHNGRKEQADILEKSLKELDS